MSARYHFDLENGHDAIRDEQGVVADDLVQAIEEALSGIEELKASGELPDSSGWTLVIRDESRKELKRVPI